MKITKILFLVFFITLINVSSVLAVTPAQAPPQPQAAPPPPPGGAIDQNLMVLLVIALFFGTYSIYKYNNIKKASM